MIWERLTSKQLIGRQVYVAYPISTSNLIVEMCRAKRGRDQRRVLLSDTTQLRTLQKLTTPQLKILPRGSTVQKSRTRIMMQSEFLLFISYVTEMVTIVELFDYFDILWYLIISRCYNSLAWMMSVLANSIEKELCERAVSEIGDYQNYKKMIVTFLQGLCI